MQRALFPKRLPLRILGEAGTRFAVTLRNNGLERGLAVHARAHGATRLHLDRVDDRGSDHSDPRSHSSPAYQNYLIRAQVTEGTMLASGAETAVWDYVAQYGTFPKDNQSAGLMLPTSITGKYVSQVEVSSGKVTATFGKEANTAITTSGHDTLVLSPVTTAATIVWTCSSTVDPKYLPSSCRG